MASINKKPIRYLARNFLFNFQKLEKINKFYLGWDASDDWEDYIFRHGEGVVVKTSKQYFMGRNPLYNPTQSMSWYVRRYWPAFDYLDKNPVRRILEVGCSYGVSAWLATDAAEHVVALDISPDVISVASHLFPEVDYRCQDYKEFLAQEKDSHFDIILHANGPILPSDFDLVLRHCDTFIDIGRSPWELKKGRAMSYGCTFYGAGLSGISPRYPKYYLHWEFLRTLLHARRSGLPLRI